VGIGALFLFGTFLGYSDGLVRVACLLSLSLFATALSLSSLVIFIGLESLHYYTLGVAVANAFFLGSIYLLGRSGAGMRGLLIAYLLFRTVEAAIQVLLLRWEAGTQLRVQFRGSDLVALLENGAPFFVLDFTVVLGQRIDVLLLTSLAGTTAAGSYAAAYRVAEVFLIVVTGLNEALLPVLTRLWKNNRGAFVGVVDQLVRYVLVATITLVIGVMAYSNSIVSLLFPGEFQEAGSILRLLVLVLVPWFPNAPLTRAILATDNQRMLIETMAIRLLIAIGLNLTLVPHLTVYGTAVATIVAILFVFVRSVWFVHQEVAELDLVRTLFLPLAAGAGFGLFVLAGSGVTTMRLAGGVIFYLVVLILVRVVDIQKIQVLKQIVTGGG
jgi:O-antigen/teichoic acid export membrane protein